MLKKLLISAAAVGLMTSAAYAGPTVMTDEKMDSVVAAGTTVYNPAGKQVWFISYGTTLINNGGKEFAVNADTPPLQGMKKGWFGN